MEGNNFGSIGFTQEQESLIGADVMIPFSLPFVLQCKATKGGVDGTSAWFYINNNQNKNQHQVLDALDRSGLCKAFSAELCCVKKNLERHEPAPRKMHAFSQING